jgi:hypothetical protein
MDTENVLILRKKKRLTYRMLVPPREGRFRARMNYGWSGANMARWPSTLKSMTMTTTTVPQQMTRVLLKCMGGAVLPYAVLGHRNRIVSLIITATLMISSKRFADGGCYSSSPRMHSLWESYKPMLCRLRSTGQRRNFPRHSEALQSKS